MLHSLETFVEIAKTRPGKKIAVAAAEDKTTLLALRRLTEEGIAEPVLVGNKEEIHRLCDDIAFDITHYRLVDVKEKSLACKAAVALVKEGEADVLTRGALETADYLRPILHKETGLKTSRLVSQAAFVEIATYHKVFAFTDSGINIAPDVNDKAQMIRQCVDVFHTLGIKTPKVAVIAATEGVKTAMPSTIDAAILSQMNKRGGIRGCLVDGPLSVDLAFSKTSVAHKGLNTEVGGDADLIVLPDINAANTFYKTVTFLGNARAASFIIGTQAPVDFPSRSDSVDTKYYAMVCAVAQCRT
ncbi:phosphate acyltransferase [Klebsiella aerogenes]|uniref:phosphate acyltransferase n=1 Tax=Klebsiella aerogenes TaxID=548 RepID=UPI001F274448|nr:phosphate acyltransferase [Klebsiella aerogenes]